MEEGGRVEFFGAADQLEMVWQVLGTVIDPELGLPITDLGLIYEVDIEDGSLTVVMTTTTPICPLGSYVSGVVEDRLLRLDFISEVETAITHDPPWSIQRLSPEAREALGM